MPTCIIVKPPCVVLFGPHRRPLTVRFVVVHEKTVCGPLQIVELSAAQ
ncbi:MAG: hypothetical protein JNM61_15145 [Zoogloeaceae bacterium]|nr:hypothetical protein [Zoogloeaceae bacterium]